MSKANYTYMVRCADGSLYTGWTNDLAKRLKAHNDGTSGAKYTRSRRPVTLAYAEVFDTPEEAQKREWHIKKCLTKAEKEALAEAYQNILPEI